MLPTSMSALFSSGLHAEHFLRIIGVAF